jgi:hypothetical protein
VNGSRILTLVSIRSNELMASKVKVKFRGWGLLQRYSLWLIVLLTPKGVPSFISRGAAHQRRTAASASEGMNYRWNLANNPVIHVSC